MIPRERAKSFPTLLSLRQKGHLASWLLSVLKRKVSWQWPQAIRHIPGVFGLLAKDPCPLPPTRLRFKSLWPSARFMIRLQLDRGQAIRRAEDLQTKRQLHGHRMYFFPDGASLIGYMYQKYQSIKKSTKSDRQNGQEKERYQLVVWKYQGENGTNKKYGQHSQWLHCNSHTWQHVVLV